MLMYWSLYFDEWYIRMATTKDLVKTYFSLEMNYMEILQSLAHFNNIILSMRTLRRLLKSVGLFRRKEYSDILDVAWK